MGQSCSFVESKEGSNLYRQVSESVDVKNFKRKLVQLHNKIQQENLQKVTFMQSSQQLIYELNDQLNTVVKLSVNKWNQTDEIQDIQIQQFLGDGTSFICKIKYYFQSYPVWKLFRIFRTSNFKLESIKNFSLFYLSFNHVNQLKTTAAKNFIHAQQCSLHTNKLSIKDHSPHSFIIQSELSLSPFVPLRNIGFFMKFNNICWHDKQFLEIIKKCLHLIQVSKPYGTFIFQQWFIDVKGQVSPIGQIIESLNEDRYIMYIKQLVLYLCETLYGQKISIHSLKQLKQVLDEKQQKSKFKHSKSVEALLEMYEKASISNPKQQDFIEIEDNQQKISNIQHYVESYRVKRRANQPSIQLALFYIDLAEYQKAKQILYETLYILLYEQMGSSSQKKRKEPNNLQFKKIDGKQFRKLSHKKALRKKSLLQLQSVLSHLICLERQLSSPSFISEELHNLLTQYLHLSLILASLERSQNNYLKSLQVLEESKEFIDKMDLWQLELHIAICYFNIGDLQKAEEGILRSLAIDINEANVCFLILFYVSVLNWEKALHFIKQNQLLISQDYAYDFLIAKIFLAKSLTITKLSKQVQKSQHLYQTIKIASRLLKRNNLPEVILCQAYEIIADGYFYLKHYETARQFYQKGLTLSNSLQFSKTKFQNQQYSYNPSFIRSASLQYTRSKSFIQSRISTIQKNPLQYSQNFNHDHQLHMNSISRTRQIVNNHQNPVNSLLSEKSSQTTFEYEPLSFIYQMDLLFDFNKKAVFLTSIANCYFMEQNYPEANKFYHQAESKVLSHNKDLINSIKGNLSICQIQMSKNSKNSGNTKIHQEKYKLQRIIKQIGDQNPSKLQNDVNYIFLHNELISI